jgi:DNA topoisomerase-1
VNDYIREISGGEFTAKDFRTWNGTVLAMRYLKVCDPPSSVTAGKRLVSSAIKSVAHELGNTPAVARKAYVHPVVVNAYLEGYLGPDAEAKPAEGYTDEELCVLHLLRAQADQQSRSAA